MLINPHNIRVGVVGTGSSIDAGKLYQEIREIQEKTNDFLSSIHASTVRVENSEKLLKFIICTQVDDLGDYETEMETIRKEIEKISGKEVEMVVKFKEKPMESMIDCNSVDALLPTDFIPECTNIEDSGRDYKKKNTGNPYNTKLYDRNLKNCVKGMRVKRGGRRR